MLVSCREVTHAFDDAGTTVKALDTVSLDVEPGELVVILGPSGSGKTTLLSVLAGLLRPTHGTAALRGVDLSSLDEEGRARARREHVGFVFQSFHLFPALTALGNVECVLDLRGDPRARSTQTARETLAAVGLGARLHHRPTQLSNGERQRVALARALAVNPAVLFADEPTSALDAASASTVLGHIERFVDARRSVVMVTHDHRVLPLATRVVTLEEGRITSDLRARDPRGG